MQELTTRTWPSAVTISASINPAAALPKRFEYEPNPPPKVRPATPTVMQPPP